MKNLRVLGVCGAQGALLFQFRKNLIANIEPRAVFHTQNEEQWKLNFGDIPFLRNANLDSISDIDIVIGSPSCGHSSAFSYSRKKSLGKPKEDPTLTLFVNAIKTIKPKVFMMENLPKLLDLIPLSEWKNNLNNYELIAHCHSVMDFGNSQKSRKRLALIGIRKDYKSISKNFKEIFPVNNPMLCNKISRLVSSELNFRENEDKKLAMYDYRDKDKKTLTVKQVKKLWLSDFQNEYKWPMKGTKMKTLPGVYRNKDNSYPLTLRPANRQFNQSGDVLGLDEFKIIMGFPKRFKVFMNLSKKQYWLNKGRNTLAKGSVYEMGVWFKKCIRKSF